MSCFSIDGIYTIAEIGINFQASMHLAKDMMRIAKTHGASCVKFQKRSIDRILCRDGLDQPYDNDRSFAPAHDRTYGAHKRALELSADQMQELQDYAHEISVEFSASAWDEESVDVLTSLRRPLPFLKLASADLTNIPLVRYAATKNVPLILSTGMADMDDVMAAVNAVRAVAPDLILCVMQCTSSYPTPADEIHLNVLRHDFCPLMRDCIIGFSSHESGTAASIGAVALGARVIERHFTLNRLMKGSDHAASLEPAEFRTLVDQMQTVYRALGSGRKRMQPSEIECYRKLTKCIVATRDMPVNHVIQATDLTVKGPGDDGRFFNPKYMSDVIGSTVKSFIAKDTRIRRVDV